MANSQLVLPDLAIASNGDVAYNTSGPYKELLINPLLGNNEQDLPTLGKQFFTSAVLMVDYDANTFTLWKANPTKDTNLLPMSNGAALPSCSFPSPPAAVSAGSAGSKLSGGALAGLVLHRLHLFG